MLEPRCSKELAKKQNNGPVSSPKRLLSVPEDLATWMRDIIHLENIDERVYYLGHHYLTRFLAITSVNRNQLQLLAAGCLLLSSKICSNSSLKSKKLIEYSDNQLLLTELLDMEMLLLSSFCWDLHLDAVDSNHPGSMDSNQHHQDSNCSLQSLHI